MITAELAQPKRRTLSAGGWLLMAVLALGVAIVSARYLTFNPALAAPPFRSRILARDPWLIAHIAAGLTALAIGAFQFPVRLRNRFLQLHRWLGRLYLVSVLVGAIAGFRIALIAGGGLPGRTGFAMLAILWLATGAMAYVRIRRHRVQSHREWMLRNYALTFAAVTLRLWLPLLTAVFGYSFVESYATVAWLSWVPNMVVAELFVARGRTGRA